MQQSYILNRQDGLHFRAHDSSRNEEKNRWGLRQVYRLGDALANHNRGLLAIKRSDIPRLHTELGLFRCPASSSVSHESALVGEEGGLQVCSQSTIVIFPFGVKKCRLHEDQVGFPWDLIGNDADGEMSIQELPSFFGCCITTVVGIAILIANHRGSQNHCR